MSPDVHHHLGDCGGAVADGSQGQAGEEELHRGTKVAVQADSQHDEQVPKHGDQVHGQEQSAGEGLQFWIFWETHRRNSETC